MPSEQPRQPKPAGKYIVPPPKPKRNASPGRKESATPPATRRWIKFALGALAFLGFSGLLVIIIMLIIPPKRACLVLLGAGYEENLAIPHNVYSWQALEDLKTMANTGSTGDSSWFSWLKPGALTVQDGPHALNDKSDWTKGWESFREKTAVIFLAFHGNTDSGGAYLLLDDATGQKRLPLRDVFDHLDHLPKDRNFVLILDATQVPAQWPLGMLHNDFARQLKALEPEIDKIQNLVVLQASDVDQRSWVSEEWRQSIFAHYLIEGLKGAAVAKSGRARITALDLHKYVCDEVKKWVQLNRNAVQTPILLGGEQRANSFELAVDEGKWRPPDPTDAPGHAFKVPNELDKAWEKCRQLKARSPAVTSPHLWRQYQDTLLRYEQLLRAGDPTRKAAGLEKELEDLYSKITRADPLPVSVQNALPLPAALGLTTPLSEELQSRFDSLWQAAEDQRPPVWDALRQWTQAKDDGTKKLLCVQLSRLLLQKAIQAPENLAKAHELIQLLDGLGGPLPAEAHYLAMLDRDLASPRPDRDLLGMALETRRLAEETALAVHPASQEKNPFPSYSELVYLWIEDRVVQADQQRRLGEDLLFASRKPDWEEARKHLQDAKNAYESAFQTAQAVQEAFRVRDEALAELPYYARWLAQRRETDGKALENAEQLCQDAHRLATQLGQPQPDPKGIDALKQLTQSVRAGLKELQGKFAARCKGLRDAHLQSNWQDIQDVLAVPLLGDGEDGAALRMELLRNSRAISDKLNSESQQPREAPVTPEPSKPYEWVQRQGRMALAVLGKPWVDKLAGDTKNAEYSVIRELIQKRDPESWNQAGEFMGHCWQLMSPQIEAWTKDAHTAGLKQAESLLTASDRLTRQMDGAAVRQLTVNPVQEYRHLRLYGLFRWLAERTFRDHWWAEEEDAEPYYRTAGLAYLDDAKRALLGSGIPLTELQKRERLAEINKLEEQLRANSRLTLSSPASLPLTSERNLELKYTLKADADALPGFPVRWLEAPFPLVAGQDVGRAVERNLNPNEPREIAYRMQPSDEAKPEGLLAKAVLHVLYRGQKDSLRKETAINLYRTPDVLVHEYPVPKDAKVAIRVDEVAVKGAIVFVLDCSGSMGTPQGVKYTPQANTKFRAARDALDKVLARLPQDTLVSILVFGHQNPQQKAIIEEIGKAQMLWNPDNPKQRKAILDEVRELEPMWDSPIVDATVRAKKYLKAAPGFKTVMVLTDGDDTVYRKEPSKARQILENTFNNTGIVVNVVLFRPEKGEKENAINQFGVVEGLNPPGQLEEVTDNNKLADALELALRPKFRLLRSGQLVKGMPKEGFPVSFLRESGLPWCPPLEHGFYTAWVRKHVKADILLDDSDRLPIDIKNQEGSMVLERALYAEYETKRRGRPVPQSKGKDWLLAVLQNQRQLATDRSLQMMITLEDYARRTPQDGPLCQRKPGFQWFEAKAQDVEKPLHLRWGNLSGYPAPAWSLEVTDWDSLPKPDATSPALHAWVLNDQPPLAVAPLKHEHDTPLDRDLVKSIPVAGDAVVVESVQFEQRSVEIEPGKSVDRGCLVVRLRYPPRKPFLVKEHGLGSAGAEHSFYSAANKYTGVFWGVTEQQINQADFYLDLISVDAVKQAAVSLELKLPAPDREPRPEKPGIGG
jgi:hypothetical protein